MASVHDVARYILDQLAPSPFGDRVTSWKLQKLIYYSLAWSLVWDEMPLFDEEIQAWANGPVCPDLYRQHRGRFRLCASDITGDPSNLSEEERDTVDSVIHYYGDKSGRWLSDLTHAERPWRDARKGLNDDEPSNALITHEAMAAYYESIQPGV